MNRNSLGCCLRGQGLARNEAEASVASHCAAGPDRSPVDRLASGPEVVARPQRRSYTAEYKVRILREAEAAGAIRGGIDATGRGPEGGGLRQAHLLSPLSTPSRPVSLRAWLGIAIRGFPDFEELCIAGFPCEHSSLLIS
jgi:hypothetical protein